MFVSTFFDTMLHSIRCVDENSVTSPTVRLAVGGMSVALLTFVEGKHPANKSGKAGAGQIEEQRKEENLLSTVGHYDEQGDEKNHDPAYRSQPEQPFLDP